MKRSLYAQITFILITIIIHTAIPGLCNAQEVRQKQTGEHIEFDFEQLRKIAEQDSSNVIIIPRVYDKPISPADPLYTKYDLRGIARPDIVTFGNPALQLMTNMPVYAHSYGADIPGIGGYSAIGLALVAYINDKTRFINSTDVISSFCGAYNLKPFYSLGMYSSMEYDVDDHLTLSTYGLHFVDNNKTPRVMRPAFVPQNIIGGSAKFKINDNVKVKVGVEVRQYR